MHGTTIDIGMHKQPTTDKCQNTINQTPVHRSSSLPRIYYRQKKSSEFKLDLFVDQVNLFKFEDPFKNEIIWIKYKLKKWVFSKT